MLCDLLPDTVFSRIIKQTICNGESTVCEEVYPRPITILELKSESRIGADKPGDRGL